MGLTLFIFWLIGWFAVTMSAASFSLRPAWFAIALIWPFALFCYVVKLVLFVLSALIVAALESVEDLWEMILGR